MEVTVGLQSSGYQVLSVDPSSESDMQNYSSFSDLPLIISGLPSIDSITNSSYTRSNQPNATSSSNMPNLFQGGQYDYYFEAMFADAPELPVEAFMQKDVLIKAAQTQWSAYWARITDAYMRVPVDQDQTIQGSVVYYSTRVFVDRRTARIMEGLLAGIVVCIIFVAFSLRTASGLPRPPHSIASQMSLFAGSKTLTMRELRRSNAQHMSSAQLRKALDGYWFGLGWWEDDAGQVRYGIDMAVPGAQPERLSDYTPVLNLAEGKKGFSRFDSAEGIPKVEGLESYQLQDMNGRREDKDTGVDVHIV
ncbi:uncharacterized protein FIBRA_06322 [Fibroporia radiculosa]|uniref:Uncharacterized protein n=1 Tax=Fibroporia radiculosa TaxID=599839 RepID=J4GSJ2_9APHY|nr:uncharacterized protein FIBRA_06322 [Fibroporia radiculosa]CCM04160.1 predicted protein [Fibroporia radiculosa]